MKNINSQSGIGLIEALIAAVVFAIGIGAVLQLQGSFFKNSSAANARSIAMSIAQEKIEDLRGFKVKDDADADFFDFVAITTNGGGNCTEQTDNAACVVALASGQVTRDNIAFIRNWAVTDYYKDNTGNLTTTVNVNGIVQKRVTVNVAWTDTDNTAQTASLDSVINQFSGVSASGPLAAGAGGSGEKPVVTYTPSNDARVTPISVGTDSKRETLVPSSTTVDGYARTKFVAYTYESGGTLLREEEFQNVACDCRFDTSTTPLTNAAAYPEWVSGLDSYIDKEGKQVDKTKGCVQGGGSNCSSNPNPLCDVCCKDHHDTNATVDGVAIAPRKYDPYRSSSDYDSSTGDHNHYNLAGTLVSSGQYLEACRLKRVNGYWRVYQDWNLVTLTTLPLSDLIDPTTKAIYASYVNSIIDEHLDESEVSGGTLTTPPTKPSALDHTDSSNYVTLSAVGEHRDLTARAVYLDYIDTTHLTALQAKKSAGSDYLLHLPFYELEVASVSNWNSGNISAVNVGPYNAPGAGIDLTGGELQSLAETSYVSVAANIKLSNSGIVALNSPIDSGDGDIYSDDVGVCVGGTCSAAPAGSCLTPWGLTVADGASVTAYENATVTSLDLCVSDTQTCSSGSLTLAYNNPSCVIAVTSTCNTSVSGSANHKDDLINLSILTGVVTTIESCTVSPSKSYTCPTVTTELSAVISVISSGTVAESTVTPTCSPPNVVNF